jgi:hypothetical protein
MRRLLLAIALAAALLAPAAARAAEPFGLESFDVTFADEAGEPETQAGAHPFAMTTKLRVNTEGALPVEAVKDLEIAAIEGLAGTPDPVPVCSTLEFLSESGCPDSSVLGLTSVTIGEGSGELTLHSPVYNLKAPPGRAAKLGFKISVERVTIEVGLGESPPYPIVAHSTDISQVLEFFDASLTLWGDPADPAHDALRGHCLNKVTGESLGECPAGVANRPFLTLPRACRGPLATSYALDSWPDPGARLANGEADLSDPAWASGLALTHDKAGNPAGLTGCGKLGFGPTIAAEPTTAAAQSASGLDFSLNVADEGLANPKGIAASDIEATEVALPEGMTINPSQAEGLRTCTEADLARESSRSAPGAGCPEASKVGAIEVETPLLEGTILKGQLFVATPYENPFGSLIAVYATIRDPGLGIFVSVPIEVRPDPLTGRLVARAEGLPQLPFSHFRLRFREGARAPLISPPECGTFATEATLHPYSGGAPVTATSSFRIVAGPGGGPCPSGPAPFAPGFAAGSQSAQAGAFSPFHARITREDGEQDLSRISFVLPPGLAGSLAGIPWCPQAGIDRAKSRTGPHGGAEELADPSCPAASKLGDTLAGAGVGTELTYVPGSLYLAGPYRGDPLSAVAITPALAGPFDAGTVVVRQALTVNPIDARVEVDGAASDPIPHLLKGIPVSVREVRVAADRDGFTFNPTSCSNLATLATLWGAGTALSPAGETPFGASSPYQAVNCAKLGFAPKLAIKLKGGTRRGAFPALRAIATPLAGNANLSRAAVTLPRSEFLEQSHFKTICTRVQFAAGPGNGALCPPGSAYGHVRAWTPILAEPVEGTAYLRSSSHNLPDLVLALQGPPSAAVKIQLAARIDSARGGIRATFEGLPDLPVSRFVLNMRGGRKGLIVNSTDICEGAHRARAKLRGQNGKLRQLRPAVRSRSCGKRHRKKKNR